MLFRNYHYGSHKWEDYLLDIQEAQDSAIQTAKDATKATNGELLRHTELLDRQVQLSEHLAEDFGEMKLELQFGFGLVVDRLDQQVRLISDVIQSLDAIHQTLRSPLITQANELWRLGEERFQKGLYDRALDAFLQSEQKNEVLFPLQLRIGTLLLEGRNAECNVINLPEAERHLLLAARYAQAEQQSTANWQEFAGKAYYRAAQAAYLTGKEDTERSPKLTRDCLERACQHLEKGSKIWPEFRGTKYLYAKCQALLGNVSAALAAIELLSDTDRHFHVAAQDDEDLSAIRQRVEDVFETSIDHPGPNAIATLKILEQAKEGISWALQCGPKAAEDKNALDEFKADIKTIEKQLNTLDVDIDTTAERLFDLRLKLTRLVERLIFERRDSLGRTLVSLTDEKSAIETELKSLRHQAELTEGSTGVGCFSAVITFVVLSVGMPLLFIPLQSQLQLSLIPYILLFFGSFITFEIISFKIGMALSRRIRKGPGQHEIDKAEIRLKKWHLSAPSAITKCEIDLDSLKDIQRSFHKWHAVNPLPPRSTSTNHDRDRYRAILIGRGTNSIETIKAVRELTQFDFNNAKRCVDNLPSLLRGGLDRNEAIAVKKRFADIGAEVSFSFDRGFSKD